MSDKTLTIQAPAKVNLCLAVHYPPQGGYHQVESVYQELDLCDLVRVSFEERSVEGARHGESPGEPLFTSLGTPVVLECAVPGLDPRDNLVFRALDAAEQACGKIGRGVGRYGRDPDAFASTAGSNDRDIAVRIEVEKHIPAGGGLGGGSSDAAAMLKAYAQITGIDVLDERLVGVARGLGADVAFFLYGGCALMTGRGDIFERALPKLRYPIVLMGDEGGLSTAAVYKAFDEDPAPVPDAFALASALENHTNSDETAYLYESAEEIVALCANNLGPAACELSPRLAARIEAARNHPDSLTALVSGSGSTSFAICADRAAAERFAHDMSVLCAWIHICE